MRFDLMNIEDVYDRCADDELDVEDDLFKEHQEFLHEGE